MSAFGLHSSAVVSAVKASGDASSAEVGIFFCNPSPPTQLGLQLPTVCPPAEER